MVLQARTPVDPKKKESRRAERHILRLQSTGVLRGKEAQTITVSDLSAVGFSFESEQSDIIGAELVIVLPEVGTASAVVTWSDGMRHGCNFAIPLNKAQMAAARLKAGPASSFSPSVNPSSGAEPEIVSFSRPIRGAIWIVGALMSWVVIALAALML